LHGVPKTIISDRGAQFIARFWEQLQSALGTKLIRSSAYHPQTDGQTERVNQIIEDMLRACIIHYGTSWDKCLALAEFSYNNSYQSSLQMAPFEVLYGRRCRTPLSWSETGERKIFGPDLVVEAEDKVKIIQANLKTAQSRQKSYADRRRKPLQFQVGDFVYLRVSPTKGVQRFGIKGKLAPRYVRPFKILEIYAQWLTEFVSHLNWLPFTMFSISLNLRSVSKYPQKSLKPVLLRLNLIYHTSNNLSKSWILRKESPEGRKSKCIRSYGIITPKKKQLGKQNSIFNETSQTSFKPIPKPNRPILFCFRISG
jgi:transposase InsO family protein